MLKFSLLLLCVLVEEVVMVLVFGVVVVVIRGIERGDTVVVLRGDIRRDRGNGISFKTAVTVGDGTD